MPNHRHTSNHKDPYKVQSKKRWPTDSIWLQPETHSWSLSEIMWCSNKLTLVGTLSRNRCHTNKDTFKGICHCQIAFGTAISWWRSTIVRMLYVARTIYPAARSRLQIQWYEKSSCRDTSQSSNWHSTKSSSSNAKYPPPSFHPNHSISATDAHLISDNSNRGRSLTHMSFPNHLSVQKKVVFRFPTLLLKFSPNEPSVWTPIPFLIRAICCHQTESLLPPSCSRLPSPNTSSPTLST